LSPIGSNTLPLAYPQTPQASCGRFGLPHFGHALRFTGCSAWCALRVRVRVLEIFFTGCI